MLSGKTAIVTGGARGIGAGITRVLATQGARVAILDLDVADEAAAAKAVRSVVERFGGLDIVVNNAGGGRGPSDPNLPRAAPGTLGTEAMSAAHWDAYLSQNLKTTFVMTAAAV